VAENGKIALATLRIERPAHDPRVEASGPTHDAGDAAAGGGRKNGGAGNVRRTGVRRRL